MDTGVPADFEALRQAVLRIRPQLPKRVAQAAVHALENPDDIAFSTTAEIARRAGVQPSTLVRFAQTLGFRGFSDLQLIFRARLKQGLPDYRDRVEALRHDPGGAALGGLLAGFTAAARQSIDRLDAAMDAARLEGAVALLARADTLHLVASRRVFPVAVYLAYAFGKLGIRAHLIDQIAGLGPEQVGSVRPGDAVLAVSYAPYASQTVEVVAAALDRGAEVLAITDSPFSPLAGRATLWLEVDEADHGAFRSLAATFALAMTLAVGTAEKRAEG